MLGRRYLAAASLIASSACGARTELEPWHRRAPSDGGSGGSGGGAEGGAGGEASCDDRVTNPAHVRLHKGGSVVLDVDLVSPRQVPELACIVSEVDEPTVGPAIASACFEAWSTWPGSLGMAELMPGNTGGLAAAQGVDLAMSLLAGDLDTQSPPGPRVAFDVSLYATSIPWTPLDPFSRHRAAFLTRTSEGKLVGGLAGVAQGAEQLRIALMAPNEIETVGPIACALGAVSADVVALGERVVVATSSGGPISRCGEEGFLPAHRLQVIGLNGGGGIELLFEAVHQVPLGNVRIARADEEQVWVAWHAAGAISVALVGPAGPTIATRLVTERSVGPVAIAMRGEEAVVGSLEPKGPGMPPDVVVHAVDFSGDVRELGRFGTADAPWIADLDLLVAPDGTSVLAAYVGMVGTSARAFARRLDCPAPRTE
jgi:hypothetical protein